MCLSRAINSPMIHALDILQICMLRDMMGSSTGTETENLHLLWWQVARQGKGDKDNSECWKKTTATELGILHGRESNWWGRKLGRQKQQRWKRDRNRH